MLIIGLTGSIGMGKSTLAAHLRARTLPVFDSDAEVHRLYAAEAVPLIEAAFPGTTADGKVERSRLAAALAKDVAGFKQLEAIVHPMVRASQRAFLQAAKLRGSPLAVLEIPLLYETGGDKLVDVVGLASAGPDEQRRRVLQRPGMTAEKLDLLLARQLPDAAKRARADFVVDTGMQLSESLAVLDKIVDSLGGQGGAAYGRHWT